MYIWPTDFPTFNHLQILYTDKIRYSEFKLRTSSDFRWMIIRFNRDLPQSKKKKMTEKASKSLSDLEWVTYHMEGDDLPDCIFSSL